VVFSHLYFLFLFVYCDWQLLQSESNGWHYLPIISIFKGYHGVVLMSLCWHGLHSRLDDYQKSTATSASRLWCSCWCQRTGSRI
jgi:hypothetical protein